MLVRKAPGTECRLVTRNYERDRRGLVPVASLLRYGEHARWEGVFTRWLTPDRLFGEGRRMVVRGQSLEVAERVGGGVELVLATWVEGVGKRSSFVLGHELRRAADDGPVATIAVLAVCLGAAGQPVAIPEELREYAAGRAAPALALGRPEGEAPEAWRSAIEVRPADLDQLQHVNHAVYLEYAEYAAEALAGASGGLGDHELAGADLDYAGSAVLGDRIALRAWWEAPGRSIAAAMRRGGEEGEVLCRARLRYRRAESAAT